jgi:hypothetical protein
LFKKVAAYECSALNNIDFQNLSIVLFEETISILNVNSLITRFKVFNYGTLTMNRLIEEITRQRK